MHHLGTGFVMKTKMEYFIEDTETQEWIDEHTMLCIKRQNEHNTTYPFLEKDGKVITKSSLITGGTTKDPMKAYSFNNKMTADVWLLIQHQAGFLLKFKITEYEKIRINQ